jgi:hypothetical protein
MSLRSRYTSFRDHGGNTVVLVDVGGNSRVGWNPQHDRIKTGALWVALQYSGSDAGNSRCTGSGCTIREREFVRCDALLTGRTDGLGPGDDL